ncbi:MAG: hypothetical protein IKN88_08405 [Bacteroidales bacterium]|nr:hypothetical protein [Bacteroidales bacterium]
MKFLLLPMVLGMTKMINCFEPKEIRIVMRKTIYTGLAALMLGLLSTACTDQLTPAAIEKENLVSEQKENMMVFHASLEQPGSATKTSLNGTNVVWNEGDQILIFSNTNVNGTVFTLKAGDGGKVSGEFEGTDNLGAGPYYAIYPASVSETLSIPFSPGATPAINAEVTANQKYSANSFGNGANVAVATATDKNLSFKNVFGAISFTLKGSASISKINIYTRESDILNGSLQITDIDTTDPVGTVSAAVKDINLYKSLSCGTGVALNDTDGVTFYIVVPAGAFANGFYAEFIDNAGRAMIKSVKGTSHVIERSKIHQMEPFTYSPQYSSAFLQESDAFSAYTAVNVAIATKTLVYTNGESQYAFKNTPATSEPADPGSRFVRFQDWSKGYALSLNIAQNPLLLNSTPKVAVTPLGNTGDIDAKPATTTMKVIKKTAERAWIVDNSGDYDGYIITLAE